MRIACIKRDIGDSRRQKIVEHLSTYFETIQVRIGLRQMQSALNLLGSFSFIKSRWMEKTKKNIYFYKSMTDNLEASLSKIQPPPDLFLQFEALYGYSERLNAKFDHIIYEDATSKLALKMWPEWVPQMAKSNSQYYGLEKHFYNNAKCIFTSNELCRQSLIEDYNVEEKKIHTVYQGFDTTKVAANKIYNKKLNKILFVGYDFKRKGGETLLKAFDIAKAKKADITLDIVGTSRNDPKDGVLFHGVVQSERTLSELYQQALIFALPAFYDPMPHAGFEAIANGCYVITTEHCGLSEIIVKKGSKQIVKSDDEEGLANAIISAMEHPDKTLEDASVDWEVLNRELTWEKVGQKMAKIIESI